MNSPPKKKIKKTSLELVSYAKGKLIFLKEDFKNKIFKN